jgi:hypothetical protein
MIFIRSNDDASPTVRQRQRLHLDDALDRPQCADISARALDVKARRDGAAAAKICRRPLCNKSPALKKHKVVAHRLNFSEIVTRKQHGVLTAQ